MYFICKLQEIELSHVVLLFLTILVIVSNLTVNMGIVDVSLRYLFHFPWVYIPSRRISGAYASSDFKSLEKHHIVFHNG